MSLMIELKCGERLQYEDGRIGKLIDMKLTPNGFKDRSLIVILYVEMDSRNGKNIMSATSNRFKPAPDTTYDELYPTVHLCKLTEKLTENGIR